jgi:hypothetical protein
VCANRLLNGPPLPKVRETLAYEVRRGLESRSLVRVCVCVGGGGGVYP